MAHLVPHSQEVTDALVWDFELMFFFKKIIYFIYLKGSMTETEGMRDREGERERSLLSADSLPK